MSPSSPNPDFPPPTKGGTYTVQSDRSVTKDSASPPPPPPPPPPSAPAPAP